MKPKATLQMDVRNQREAEAVVRLFRSAGIPASTDIHDLRKIPGYFYGGKKTPVYVYSKDARKAHALLRAARNFAEALKKIKKITLPPEEGTLENLDMLIHDSRQYLMIAAGEIKSIEEEGALAFDEPTNDIKKITIRLKRLKSQCMTMAGKRPLDWEHHGGLDL